MVAHVGPAIFRRLRLFYACFVFRAAALMNQGNGCYHVHNVGWNSPVRPGGWHKRRRDTTPGRQCRGKESHKPELIYPTYVQWCSYVGPRRGVWLAPGTSTSRCLVPSHDLVLTSVFFSKRAGRI